MNFQKLMAMGAGSVIALAAAAQVAVPPCCKYLWEWPAEENPNGACAGNSSYTCQTGTTFVRGDDPLLDAKSGWIQAQCFRVTLHGDAEFYHVDCADLPPNGIFIGVLPNGQCCYAVGETGDIESVSAGYVIRKCEGNCWGTQS